MSGDWSPEEFIRRRKYADKHATSLYDWWDHFESPEAMGKLQRADQPGLLVRWWYWRTARQHRRATRLMTGQRRTATRGGVMFGNDGGGSNWANGCDLYDKPRHWWYR